MDLQKTFDTMMDLAMKDRARYHLTIGKAIKKLKKFPQNVRVHFADGDSPADLSSYRGYYSDLCVESGPTPITVADFLKALEKIKGTTLEGYKGGEYLMHENVPMWHDEYSRCQEIAIVDLTLMENQVLIVTKGLDDDDDDEG